MGPGSADRELRLRCLPGAPVTRVGATVAAAAAEVVTATLVAETAGSAAETGTGVAAEEGATTEAADGTVVAGGTGAEADRLAVAVAATAADVTAALAGVAAEVAGGLPPARRQGLSRETGPTPETGWTEKQHASQKKQQTLYSFFFAYSMNSKGEVDDDESRKISITKSRVGSNQSQHRSLKFFSYLFTPPFVQYCASVYHLSVSIYILPLQM